MRLNATAAASILLLLASGPVAAAQEATVPGWEAGEGPSRRDDPLAVDRDDRLEQVSPTRPEDEVERRIPVQRGDVLAAIAGVRETRHELSVELAHGLARVDVEMHFVSTARHAAELEYRLAVPEGARVIALEVENGAGARRGLRDTHAGVLGAYDDAVRSHGGLLPVAHVAPVHDARGHALRLRAAPVRRAPTGMQGGPATAGDGSLTVRLSYVVSAPVRGGAVRIRLPARGRDHRVAASTVRVRSETLSRATVDREDAVEAAVVRAANREFEIAARVSRGGPAVAAEILEGACGSSRCARVRVVAAPRTQAPDEVIVLLDVSPSTAGPTRGRLLPTLGSLLSALPQRTRVRVATFAARARAVVEAPTAPTDISLADVQDALESDLGSATRFEGAWSLIEPWLEGRGSVAVVLIGDGGLTTGASDTSFAALRSSRAQLTSLNVADRPSTGALRDAVEGAGGLVIDAGAEAARAASGHGPAPLRERLSLLLSPVVQPRVRVRVGRRTVSLGPLRAGEERVFEALGRVRLLGAPSVTRDAAEHSAALAARIADAPFAEGPRFVAIAEESNTPAASCRVRGTFTSASAPVPEGVLLAPATVRRCGAPPPELDPHAPLAGDAPFAPAGTPTLPMRSLRDLLRQRLVPVARGCFRDDRRGRAHVQRRAVYRFTLADREVLSAEVTGRIEARLRSCLLRAVDDLEIPRFSGTLSVSYPLYTRAVLPAPTLSLDADVADAVDAVLEPSD